MKRVVLYLVLSLASLAHAGHGNPDLDWLDRSLAHFLVMPHATESRYVESMVPETSEFFRRHIFRVRPNRFGVGAPVKRFLMKDFEVAVRAYFAAEPASDRQTERLVKELRNVMYLEGLPVGLSAEEFQRLLVNPRLKRFAPLSELAMENYEKMQIYKRMINKYELRTVREAIASLRSDDWPSLAKNFSPEERAAVQQAIDELLARDGDWEFCDRNLAGSRRVPKAYLARFGYELE